MDSHEAARAVFSRIQRIDPENAPKIVGYILLQDQADKEMIRLAFGPDNILHSVIARAKTVFALSSKTPYSPSFSSVSISKTNPCHNLSSSPSSPSIWSISCSNDSPSLRDWSLDDNSDYYHGEIPSTNVGKFDAFEEYQEEVLRSKVAQQQRLAAAQYMAGINSPHNKLSLSFLQREAQRSAAAAALMMEEEMHKLNRFRIGRNGVSEMGYGDSAPVSRQIYLTFPADSTFKEEDVSNYFSIFGPVQDVRIPYQQKRMFGFVTFLYPETVRIILAKGNPHFVCDSRVLVKPYKEKGKQSDKKHQLDRYEFSCSSPSGLDREPFEMHVGPRMFNNNQDMLRKKLEQELRWEQALEFQRRRLMNLQLLDLNNHHRYQHDAYVGSPPHSASNHETSMNQSIPPTSANVFLDDALEENQRSPTASPTKKPQEDDPNGNKKDNSDIKVSDVSESEYASPTKSSAEDQSIFAPKLVDTVNDVAVTTSTANNALNMAPPQSCFLEIPRLSSEHGAIGM